MSANRIYMGSDMLESYANYNEAAESFLDGIALENISLDTNIQLEFGITDDDVFSDHAMEAIGETVKNMASKAKSNFVTYAKKLINFLFGWLIRFFQGATNVKKAMKDSYQKANTYLKKLNELETKARGANKEDKIEITDWGNCVLVGLFMIQAIIWSTQDLGSGLKEASSSTSTTSNNGDGARNTTTRGFQMMDILLSKLETLYATIGSIDISKPNDLIAKIRGKNFNIPALMEEYKRMSGKVKKDARNEVLKDEANENGMVKTAGRKVVEAGNNAVAASGNKNAVNRQKNRKVDVTDKTVSKLEGTYKSRMEDTAKYMSDPNKAEMGLSDAYDELRNKLKLFLDISKANKWDLEKNIQSAEKIRRGLEKEINAMNLTQVNEADVSALLKKIISVGNNLGQIQRSAGVVVKQITRSIDGLTVDVAKLGSKVIKIGGNN